MCVFVPMRVSIGNQPAPYRGLPGPPCPKCRKVSKVSPRTLPAPGPQKVSKKSRGQSGKSPESLRKVFGECFWSALGLFGDFLGSPGLRPRETFSRLFGISGPEGPKYLCKGHAGSLALNKDSQGNVFVLIRCPGGLCLKFLGFVLVLIFPSHGLSVPNVSRECRCLQTSPEQLQARKDKKDSNFRPREAREFLSGWDKNSNTVKSQKFHTSGVCLREDEHSRIKIAPRLF